MSAKYSSFTQYCVGRSTVQLPNEFSMLKVISGSFQPAIHNSEKMSFDVVVDGNRLKEENFSKHLLLRRSELKSNRSETIDVLRMEQNLSSSATLFRVQQIKDTYKSEIHFVLGDNLIVLTADSYENTFLTIEKRLVEIMSAFIPVDGEKTNGFCLGTLAITGDFVVEGGEYFWRDDAGNTFEIKTSTFNSNGPETLLLRMAGPGSLLSLFHVGHTVLRSGERTVSGMRAQEWLGWTDFGEHNDGKTFKFVTETMRPVASKSRPLIKVTFDSAQKLEDGTNTKTNLSDKEAMAMWDKVLDSIRPNE